MPECDVRINWGFIEGEFVVRCDTHVVEIFDSKSADGALFPEYATPFDAVDALVRTHKAEHLPPAQEV